MVQKNLRWMASLLLAANLAAVTPGTTFAAPGNSKGGTTTTPIKHLVVIFQENVSFDHYFATYPQAANKRGEVRFKAKGGTPTVNGLSQGLLDHNQNTDKGGIVYQPVRLDPSQNYTCDMNHDYTPEQQAFDSGLMDKFPEFTSGGGCSNSTYPSLAGLGPGVGRGSYDANPATGLWTSAKHFAREKNHNAPNFGPPPVGEINFIP